MARNFMEMLKAKWDERKFVCVGLDSEFGKIPESARRSGSECDVSVANTVVAFNRAIVKATKDLVCAYKPNAAFYEAHGGEGIGALQRNHRGHPRHRAGRSGDSRRQARGHRQHQRGLCGCGVRLSRCGRNNGASVSRSRSASTVPRASGEGRHRTLPHIKSGRGRISGFIRERRTALLLCRASRGKRVEQERQLRARRGRNVSR